MTGIERIAAERKRQIEEEGFTEEHDGQWKNGELPRAAAIYALVYNNIDFFDDWDVTFITYWPWDLGWYKPDEGNIRCLEKAGALIAAEIDRLQRSKESAAT
jgi:hypothetical protein